MKYLSQCATVFGLVVLIGFSPAFPDATRINVSSYHLGTTPLSSQAHRVLAPFLKARQSVTSPAHRLLAFFQSSLDKQDRLDRQNAVIEMLTPVQWTWIYWIIDAVEQKWDKRTAIRELADRLSQKRGTGEGPEIKVDRRTAIIRYLQVSGLRTDIADIVTYFYRKDQSLDKQVYRSVFDGITGPDGLDEQILQGHFRSFQQEALGELAEQINDDSHEFRQQLRMGIYQVLQVPEQDRGYLTWRQLLDFCRLEHSPVTFEARMKASLEPEQITLFKALLQAPEIRSILEPFRLFSRPPHADWSPVSFSRETAATISGQPSRIYWGSQAKPNSNRANKDAHRADEDAHFHWTFPDGTYLVVDLDGMGGGDHAALASRIAGPAFLMAMQRFWEQNQGTDQLDDHAAVLAAIDEAMNEAQRVTTSYLGDFEESGTTLVATWARPLKDGTGYDLYAVSAGDSQSYVASVEKGWLWPLSIPNAKEYRVYSEAEADTWWKTDTTARQHAHVDSQGMLPAEQVKHAHRHVIHSGIGPGALKSQSHKRLAYSVVHARVPNGSIVFQVTDGVSDPASWFLLAETAAEAQQLSELPQMLIDTANSVSNLHTRYKGGDDTTVSMLLLGLSPIETDSAESLLHVQNAWMNMVERRPLLALSQLRAIGGVQQGWPDQLIHLYETLIRIAEAHELRVGKVVKQIRRDGTERALGRIIDIREKLGKPDKIIVLDEERGHRLLGISYSQFESGHVIVQPQEAKKQTPQELLLDALMPRGELKRGLKQELTALLRTYESLKNILQKNSIKLGYWVKRRGTLFLKARFSIKRLGWQAGTILEQEENAWLVLDSGPAMIDSIIVLSYPRNSSDLSGAEIRVISVTDAYYLVDGQLEQSLPDLQQIMEAFACVPKSERRELDGMHWQEFINKYGSPSSISTINRLIASAEAGGESA